MDKPKLILMCGIPASGKSHIAKNMADNDTIVLSSDSIRLELLGSENCQDNNQLVFNTLYHRAKEHLINGKNVIIDACNINRKDRQRTLSSFQGMDIYRSCIVSVTLPEICIERDIARGRTVGKSVINKFLYRFEVPMEFEGFNRIEFALNDNNYSVVDTMTNNANFNQQNPHHKYTLDDHCELCWEEIIKTSNNLWLNNCCAVHDIGKLYTQTFDLNGIAHYYSHANVGAYYCLCSKEFETNILSTESIFYINYHMLPFQIKEEKTKDKYIKLFGEILFNNLMLLHECDKIASGTYE